MIAREHIVYIAVNVYYNYDNKRIFDVLKYSFNTYIYIYNISLSLCHCFQFNALSPSL